MSARLGASLLSRLPCAKVPDGRLVDFTLRSLGAGMLTGLCSDCGAVMHKAVRRADLEPIRAQSTFT
jgi:hypothetical protein